MTEPSWVTGAVAASDGYALGYRKYPSSSPKGPVVACVHGIQSHAGWYDRSCKFFADSGFTAYFIDRRGSGMNAVERGHASGIRILIDDFKRCLAMIRQEHPSSPIVVEAISWGAKAAIAALADDQKLADGLILVAPGLRPKVRPPLFDQLRIVMGTIFRPKALLPVPLDDPALFTDNPKWRRFIADDPLSIRRASARLLFTSKVLDFRLRRVAHRLALPTLLILASDDRIIDNDQTRRFLAGLAATDKEIVELPGGHTLEFEADPMPFFEIMKKWIEKWFLRHSG